MLSEFPFVCAMVCTNKSLFSSAYLIHSLDELEIPGTKLFSINHKFEEKLSEELVRDYLTTFIIVLDSNNIPDNYLTSNPIFIKLTSEFVTNQSDFKS